MKEPKSFYTLISEKPGRYTGVQMSLQEIWELIRELRNNLNKVKYYWRNAADEAILYEDADILWKLTVSLMHPEIKEMMESDSISEEELDKIMESLRMEDLDEEEKTEAEK